MATKPIAKAATVKVARPLAPPAAKVAIATPTAKATVTRRTTDARQVRPRAEREGMIAEAAYLIAERRGFTENDSVSDWLAAEQQIDAAWRFE